MSKAFSLVFEYFAEKGKPTTIFSSLYVESFGNIEEANMVCVMDFILCILILLNFNSLGNLFVIYELWHNFLATNE